MNYLPYTGDTRSTQLDISTYVPYTGNTCANQLYKYILIIYNSFVHKTAPYHSFLVGKLPFCSCQYLSCRCLKGEKSCNILADLMKSFFRILLPLQAGKLTTGKQTSLFCRSPYL